MPIFISSTPTIEKDDVQLAKKLLKQKDTTDIEVKLPGFEDKKHFYTNMGRSSLYIILKALGISKEDEVIIQSFTCMALVVPILWLEARPIYTDIDLNTFNMALDSLKKRISKKTRAVIVQHTFGIPSPILEIKEYIKELNEERQQEQKIYLIEDCAHSLNIKLMDKYLGSFGDASFFSFGQDKVLSTTQGGCAIANSKKLEKKIEDIYKETSNIPEKLVKYNLRYPILWSIIKKTYFFPTFIANSKKFSRFTLGRFLILLFRFLGLTKQQASKNDFGTPQNDVYRLSTKQKYLLKKQLDKLERISKHRKENVQKYSKILNKEYSGSLIRYPLTVDNPSKVRSKLKEIKVIAGNWYNYPVIPKGIDLKSVKYHLGRNPNTEYLIEHIVNLPTGIHVSKSDIDSISQIVKSHILKE